MSKAGTVEAIKIGWEDLNESTGNSGSVGTVIIGGKGLEV
jgi:hypothetical protein